MENLYYTSHNGRPDESRIIAEYRTGDVRVVIEEGGATSDVDVMLTGRVTTWGPDGLHSVGLIFDATRYLVSAAEPLNQHAADALEEAGFIGVREFRA